MALMTKSAYARHRDCSKSYISKLLKQGVIVETKAGLIDVKVNDLRVDALRQRFVLPYAWRKRNGWLPR